MFNPLMVTTRADSSGDSSTGAELQTRATPLVSPIRRNAGPRDFGERLSVRMARRKVNLAGCARRGRHQRKIQILEWLGNARRVRFQLADEQSSIRGDSGVESDAIHRAVTVIVEAPADAGPKSGEPALNWTAVLFETP